MKKKKMMMMMKSTKLKKKKRVSAGFTLLEIMLSVSILVLSIIGMVSVITYTTTQNEINRENLLAMRAAEGKIEEMRRYDVSEIFARYSATDANPTTKSYLPGTLGTLAGLYPGPDFSDLFDPTKIGTYDPTYQRLRNASARIEFPWQNSTLVAGAFGPDSNYRSPPSGSIALHEESNPATEPDQIARDLNADGIVADGKPTPDSPSVDYVILPAKIIISWKSIKGNRTITYRYMFLKKS
jgi:type II secretory pathway pseudopilin PulG